MDGAAVVTGASSGIGEAVARQLLDSGRTVITLQRRPPRFRHERLLYYAVDLADAGAARRIAGEVAAGHAVRYLVNNAGVNRPGMLEQTTVEDLDYAMAVNVRAAMVLTQAFAPGMRAAGFGRIVNISSAHGLRASTYKAAYVTAKHGLEGLSKVIALEGGPKGVTSNCINPSYVRTPLVEKQIADQAKAHGIPESDVVEKIMLTETAIKRLIEPHEVAELAAYLCSPEASYINGASLPIDGGWTAQ